MSISYMIIEKPLPISKLLSISKIIVKARNPLKNSGTAVTTRNRPRWYRSSVISHRIKRFESAIPLLCELFHVHEGNTQLQPVCRAAIPSPSSVPLRNSPHHNYHHKCDDAENHDLLHLGCLSVVTVRIHACPPLL
jgi:hypothetical protein